MKKGFEHRNRLMCHFNFLNPKCLAFLINLGFAFVVFSFFMWRDGSGGLFSLSNDFDAQELAFNMFANREIKAGNIYFNWAIDIGSDFISSFSFYNLGSPFFWITLLFPPSFFPYLVGWIYMLKYAVAGLTAYLYLERYVQNKQCAVIGSVLYAFSGFQAANLVFYHFHDVVAFFPLLLLGIDKAVSDRKRVYMALAVFINALVNWNFFFGEVIFSLLYFAIRYAMYEQIKQGNYKLVLKQVLDCMLAGILGVGMAAILFIPSVASILQNSRISNHINGSSALAFPTQDYLQLLKALLLPGDTLCNQFILDQDNWYSVAAYLPLTGITLVVVYLSVYKNDWISKILKISLCIALIPVLNNMFVLFNVEPYRRWYYMPILIMVLATVKILERIMEADIRKKIWKSSCAVIIIILGLYLYLKLFGWSQERSSAINQPAVFKKYIVLGIGGVFVTAFIVRWLYNRKNFYSLFLIAVGIMGCINIGYNLYRYHRGSDWKTAREAYNELVKATEPLQPDVLPYRYAMNNPVYNRNMANSLTSLDSYISTVDSGIFEFYDALYCHRHTVTIDGPDGTIELLSGRYYVQDEKWEGRDPDQIINNGNRDIYIYEDINALPVGFTYNSYITKTEFAVLDPGILSRVMMRTLVVADEDVPFVSDRLEHYDLNKAEEFSGENKFRDFLNHQEESSVEFVHSTKGFQSVIRTDANKYAFFSVPYNNRWSATVNNNNVHILNINGLMAVPVEKGENKIEFTYSITINRVSLIVSIFSFFIVFFLLLEENKQKNNKEVSLQ